MTEPTDDPTEEFRREIAASPTSIVSTPEEFGLRFLTVDELIEKAEATAPGRLGSLRREARRRTWLLGAAAGLTAAAATVVMVVLPPTRDEAPPPIASPSPSVTESRSPATFDVAREVLLAAALVKGPQTAEINYWQVKSIQVFGTEEVPREIWLGNGRPSVLRQDGFVDRLPAASFPAGGESIGWQALQRLPSRPEQLSALLSRDATAVGRDKRWTIFKAAGDLIAEAPVPPQVRSALWRVLASQPGAGRTNQALDHAGRRGWTVSMSLPAEGSITYLVDPVSGQLLEARYKPSGGRPPWTVTFLERGPAEVAPPLTDT